MDNLKELSDNLNSLTIRELNEISDVLTNELGIGKRYRVTSPITLIDELPDEYGQTIVNNNYGNSKHNKARKIRFDARQKRKRK